MKALILGLSLVGLIMGTSVSKANQNTEENLPVFKADQSAATTAKVEVAKNSSGSNLWLRVLISLAIVMSLFGGGLYFLKRLPNTNRFTNKAKMIQVLSQHYLGAKKSLAVVRVAGETVLIGITDENISHLKTLSLLDDDLPNKKFNATLENKIQEDAEEFKFSKRSVRI